MSNQYHLVSDANEVETRKRLPVHAPMAESGLAEILISDLPAARLIGMTIKVLVL